MVFRSFFPKTPDLWSQVLFPANKKIADEEMKVILVSVYNIENCVNTLYNKFSKFLFIEMLLRIQLDLYLNPEAFCQEVWVFTCRNARCFNCFNKEFARTSFLS